MATKKIKPKVRRDEPYTLFDELEYDFTKYYPDVKTLIIKFLECFPLSCDISGIPPQHLCQEVVLESAWHPAESESEFDVVCGIAAYDQCRDRIGEMWHPRFDKPEFRAKAFVSYTDYVCALGCILPFMKAYACGSKERNWLKRGLPVDTVGGQIMIEPVPFDIADVLDNSKKT